jgi:hypothetical protein
MNLAALLLLANDQAPQTLEMSARKQQMKELVQEAKLQHERHLEAIRNGYSH